MCIIWRYIIYMGRENFKRSVSLSEKIIIRKKKKNKRNFNTSWWIDKILIRDWLWKLYLIIRDIKSLFFFLNYIRYGYLVTCQRLTSVEFFIYRKAFFSLTRHCRYATAVVTRFHDVIDVTFITDLPRRTPYTWWKMI